MWMGRWGCQIFAGGLHATLPSGVNSPQMKLGIAAKLFLLLLLTSITVSVVMSVATRMSFRSGFLGYLDAQGISRVETLVPAFAAEYRRHGSWSYFRGNLRAWIEMLRTTARPPKSPDLASVHLRMALLDADRNFVIGYQSDLGPGFITRPIIVDGKAVGHLALRSQQTMLTAADLRFQHRQLIAAWIIGASVVLIAALGAFKISRTLVTPLQRITLATQQLANGNFDNRVAVSSGDEIGQLSNDFNVLAATLKRNEQLRREFMADIAHELRTPLSVLRGELEAMQDRVIEPSGEAIDSLHAEVATLSKVVEDLYELSLADIGALNYRKAVTNVGNLLRMTSDVFVHRFAALELTLATQIDEAVLSNVDPQRVQQLFNNLLENMARYTQTPGALRIECRAHEGRVHIEFHNSGPGVPAERLGHLFERHYRGEAPMRGGGGAGLGLAICRKIVEAHGGEIAALASPLGGVLIRVQLEAEAAP